MGLSCQFAVTAWDLSSPAALAGLPQQAKRAEAMGFEGFWLPEHHFQGGASCLHRSSCWPPAQVPPKPSTLPRHHYSYPSDKPLLSQKKQQR